MTDPCSPHRRRRRPPTLGCSPSSRPRCVRSSALRCWCSIRATRCSAAQPAKCPAASEPAVVGGCAPPTTCGGAGRGNRIWTSLLPRPTPSAGQGLGRGRSWIRCQPSNAASVWPVSARNCGWKSNTCCSVTVTTVGSRPRRTRWRAWCGCWQVCRWSPCWTGTRRPGEPGWAGPPPTTPHRAPWSSTATGSSKTSPTAPGGRWNIPAMSGGCATSACQQAAVPRPACGSTRSPSRG